MTDPPRSLPTLRRALAGAAVLALGVTLLVGRIDWRVAGGGAGANSAASADTAHVAPRADDADGASSASSADGAIETVRPVRPDGADRADHGADSRGDSRGDIAQREPPAAVVSHQTVLGNVAEAGVREGEVAVVDFVVPRRAVVHGLVVVDGRPVPGAVVHHRPHVAWALCHRAWLRMTAPSPETVTTGADGRFEQSLPYGGELVFWAVAPDGHVSQATRINLSTGTSFDVKLAMQGSRP